MRKKLMIPVMLLMALTVLMNACKDKRIKEWGIVKDSCLIKIMPKPMDKKGNVAAGDGVLDKDTLVDLVISFETSKKLPKQDEHSELVFGMQGKFALVSDTAFLLPIFCQPIATGNTQKYAYWVSFEASKELFNRGRNGIVIQPSILIKDSVHYKLL